MAGKTFAALDKLQKSGKLAAAMTSGPVKGQGPEQIDINKIKPDPDQPRKEFDKQQLKELSASIERLGILQPITVQPPDDASNHRIIMGERRWRAALEAGLKTVPVIIMEATPELRAMQITENIQRADLTTMEIAAAVEQLAQDGRSRPEIAQILGWSAAQISAFRQILKMDPRLQELAQASVQARALSDLHSLWKKDQSAVEKFIDETKPDDITRVAVAALRDEISGTRGIAPTDRDELPPTRETTPGPAAGGQRSAQAAKKGGVVLIVEHDGAIGRIVTDEAASTSKAVIVSFDNGARREEVALEKLSLVEALAV